MLLGFREARLDGVLPTAIYHFFLLQILLFIIWIPHFLLMLNLKPFVEKSILVLRHTIMMLLFFAFIPYQLIQHILRGLTLFDVVFLSGIMIVFAYLLSLGLLLFRKDKEKVGMDHEEILGYLKERDSYKALSFFFIIGLVLLMEFWIVGCSLMTSFLPAKQYFEAPVFVYEVLVKAETAEKLAERELVYPYANLYNSIARQQDLDEPLLQETVQNVPFWKTIEPGTEFWDEFFSVFTAWLAAAILCTALFIAFGGLTARVLAAALHTALQQPEKMHKGPREIVLKSGVYGSNFRNHIMKEFPFSVLGGFAGTLLFLGIPIVLHGANRFELVAKGVNEDTMFFALALIAAWIGPVIMALFKIDYTFGQHFNRAIADIIMDIREHVVYVGYGDLGRRVVARDVKRTFILDRENNFTELVTPDLVIMRICRSAVVIDVSDKDFVYAAEIDLLGRYGVVMVDDVGGMRLNRLPRKGGAITEADYYDARRRWQYSENKPVIVPALRGEIEQPFVSARSNLERARLLIGTLPEDHIVNIAFSLAESDKTRAILCVTRSDQMAYLTYRTSMRPIVLIYPTANQGATMGQRLWAAVLKSRAILGVQGRESEHLPKILIAGQSKARYYLLEILWNNLPGTYSEKTAWLEQHIALIDFSDDHVSYAGSPGETPRLKSGVLDKVLRQVGWTSASGAAGDTGDADNIDKGFVTLRMGSGRRYCGEAPRLIASIPAFRVPSSYAGPMQKILQEFMPNIIIMTPEEMESSLRVLMQILRALELLYSIDRKGSNSETTFPLLLLSLVHGVRNEQVALGNASGFYRSLSGYYRQKLPQDKSYPACGYWSDRQKTIVGESIIDSKAESDEMVAGVHESLFIGIPGARRKAKIRGGYIELNTCIPNIPGSLAAFTAHIAGLKFADPCTEIHGEPIERVPSLQYLRVMPADLHGHAYVLTGYAGLDSTANLLQCLDRDKPAFFVRLFANDGRDNRGARQEKNEPLQRPSWLARIASRIFQRQNSSQSKRHSPGAIGALNFIAGNTQEAADGSRGKSLRPTFGAFQRILFDSKDEAKPGPRACPGMNTCPIATYQDAVMALNPVQKIDARLARRKLFNAPNYYCREAFIDAPKPAPHPAEPMSARIMICSRTGTNDPGKTAHALNALIFRDLVGVSDGYVMQNDPDVEWLINIQYFKELTCQNNCFNLNRTFGFWVDRDKSSAEKREWVLRRLKKWNPIQLVEILPIGSKESARAWLQYATQLLHFLNEFGDRGSHYRLVWHDSKNRVHRIRSREQANAQGGKGKAAANAHPVAIIIHRENPLEKIARRTPEWVGDYEMCTICGMQGKAHSCEKWRPWHRDREIYWERRKE